MLAELLQSLPESDVNSADSQGCTCLYYATSRGEAATAAFLLQAGAAPRKRYGKAHSGATGNTLLHQAVILSGPQLERSVRCELPRSKVVSILLRAYPQAAEQRNIADWLPLQLFLRVHSSAVLTEEDDLDVIFQLLQAKPLPQSELLALCEAAFHSQHSAEIFKSNAATVILIGAALVPGEKKVAIPLHLCGDSYSGKTTLRSSLSFVFAPNQAYLRVFRSTPTKISQDSGDEGRTVGLEIEVMTQKERHWLVHDYGGSHRLHVDHARLFAGVEPVYVLVLPLWDIRTSAAVDESLLRARFEDWLRYIHSSLSDTGCSCITVLNFYDQVGDRRGKEIAAALGEIQSEWSQIEGVRIRFVETILVNANKPSEIEGSLKPALRTAARSRGIAPSMLPTCVELARKGKVEAQPRRWPKAIEEGSFKEDIVRPLLATLLPVGVAVVPVPRSVFDRLYEQVKKGLCELGDIVYLPPSSSDPTAPSWIVTDINWLASDVPREILHSMRSHSTGPERPLREYLLSQNGVVRYAGDSGRHFEGSSLKCCQLLSSLGLLLQVVKPLHQDHSEGDRWRGGEADRDRDRDSVSILTDLTQSQGHDASMHVGRRVSWVPHFVLRLRGPNDGAIPSVFLSCGDPAMNRILKRRFELKKSSLRCFPHDFLPELFVQAARLQVGSHSVRMFENGLEFESVFESVGGKKAHVLVSLTVDDNRSFNVIVASNTTQPCQPSPSYAWRTMQDICDLCRAGSRVSSLSEDLELDEVCINPGGSSDEFRASELKMTFLMQNQSSIASKCYFGTDGNFNESVEYGAEQAAIAGFVNSMLRDEERLRGVVPVAPASVCEALSDGVLLGE